MHHFRSKRRTYRQLNSRDKHRKRACSFPLCQGDPSQPIADQNDTMYIIENRATYDVFEGRRVLDHRMVIPKRHVETLADFTDQEKLDHMAMVGQYEEDGYNVYSRGVGSVSRSVKHQHTHLIKLSNTMPKGIVFIEKPYFLMHV